MVDVKYLPMDKRFNLYKLNHLMYVNFDKYTEMTKFLREWNSNNIISVISVRGGERGEHVIGYRVYFVGSNIDIDYIKKFYEAKSFGGVYQLDTETKRVFEGYGYEFYEWNGRRWEKDMR